ncbi:unnamed protein product, partial [Prorocentrum cordatum]
MEAALGYSEAGLGGLPAVWRPSTRRAQDEAILGPTAARRAARRRCQQACEAALRNLLAAAAAPGSWQDRERAARPALRLAAAGARVPGSARRRRNAAWHAAVAPAAGFARACDAAISAAASGPRLGAPAPCTPPAAPRLVAPTTPTKLRKEAPPWPEGWQALGSEGKGLGGDDDGDETSEQPTAAPLLSASLGLGLRQEGAGEPFAAARASDGAHGVPAEKDPEVQAPVEDEEEVMKECGPEDIGEGVGEMHGSDGDGTSEQAIDDAHGVLAEEGLEVQAPCDADDVEGMLKHPHRDAVGACPLPRSVRAIVRDAPSSPTRPSTTKGDQQVGRDGVQAALAGGTVRGPVASAALGDSDASQCGPDEARERVGKKGGGASDEYFGPPAAWAAVVAERERGRRTSRPFLRRRAELSSEAKAATQRLRTIFDAWWRVGPYVNDLYAYGDGVDGPVGVDWAQRSFEPQM